MAREVFGTDADDTFRFKSPNRGLEISGLGDDDGIRVQNADKRVSVWGNGGDDKIVLSGADQIAAIGGGGDDKIKVKGTATAAFIEVWGGKGDDKIVYKAKPDGELGFVNGGKGDDLASVKKGNVVVTLGKGEDTLKFNFKTLASGAAAADVIDFDPRQDKLKIAGNGDLSVQGWNNDNGDLDVLQVGETIIRMKDGDDVLEAFGIQAGGYGSGYVSANEIEKVFKNPDKFTFDLVA